MTYTVLHPPHLPEIFSELATPVTALWCWGNVEALGRGLGVVGSRKMSVYGRQQCQRFVTPISRLGVPIVSGLAYGIDTEAHRIALHNGAPCIAVLGGGFDKFYPSSSMGVARNIVASGGVVISEYPPDMPSKPFQFLARNRIIAALSLALLVVEAGQHSGTRNTAASAASIGSSVYVIPGDISREQSLGIVSLIRDGAEPLAHPDELVEVFRETALREGVLLQDNTSFHSELSGSVRQVYGALTTEGVTVDTLVAATNLSTSVVRSVLGALEIDGLVGYNQGLWHTTSSS